MTCEQRPDAGQRRRRIGQYVGQRFGFLGATGRRREEPLLLRTGWLDDQTVARDLGVRSFGQELQKLCLVLSDAGRKGRNLIDRVLRPHRPEFTALRLERDARSVHFVQDSLSAHVMRTLTTLG
jgi:hypothetical protein